MLRRKSGEGTQPCQVSLSKAIHSGNHGKDCCRSRPSYRQHQRFHLRQLQHGPRAFQERGKPLEECNFLSPGKRQSIGRSLPNGQSEKSLPHKSGTGGGHANRRNICFGTPEFGSKPLSRPSGHKPWLSVVALRNLSFRTLRRECRLFTQYTRLFSPTPEPTTCSHPQIK